jgi:excisionase family DNA binding protein
MDQALAALQTARRLAAEMSRVVEEEVVPRAPAPRRYDERYEEVIETGPSLRYTGMTVAEAAIALGIGEEQVRRLLRRGQLIGVPFGGRVGWRLSREYVDEVVAEWKRAQAAKVAARASGSARGRGGAGRSGRS